MSSHTTIVEALRAKRVDISEFDKLKNVRLIKMHEYVTCSWQYTESQCIVVLDNYGRLWGSTDRSKLMPLEHIEWAFNNPSCKWSGGRGMAAPIGTSYSATHTFKHQLNDQLIEFAKVVAEKVSFTLRRPGDGPHGIEVNPVLALVLAGLQPVAEQMNLLENAATLDSTLAQRESEEEVDAAAAALERLTESLSSAADDGARRRIRTMIRIAEEDLAAAERRLEMQTNALSTARRAVIETAERRAGEEERVRTGTLELQTTLAERIAEQERLSRDLDAQIAENTRLSAERETAHTREIAALRQENSVLRSELNNYKTADEQYRAARRVLWAREEADRLERLRLGYDSR